jgi:SUMO ligase MMS21 Smc5/6 complex component
LNEKFNKEADSEKKMEILERKSSIRYIKNSVESISNRLDWEWGGRKNNKD